MIISGAELSNYFGKEKTPQEMKAQIIKLLDDWKGKEQKQAKPEKRSKANPRAKLAQGFIISTERRTLWQGGTNGSPYFVK